MASHSDESNSKRIDTFIENYGVDNPMKSEKVQDKFKETNMERYGYEYPAQNADIFNKTQMSGLKYKSYNGILYQGTYEMDFLVKLESLNLLNEVSKIKSIKYNFNNKVKYYHPDFFIEKLNLIVEIKSEYYYNLYLEKNLIKMESCRDQGYDFIFIMDKNYTEFLEKIKPII